jgi:hypothetical protein
MEATTTGYGDGLIARPMASCLPEKLERRNVTAEKQ